ncbi:MAG: aminotransferase class I/II-fold pyridoxal phosphate-dependent enzyme [Bacteroidota bacterium]|nr:aminotransferase class I/II-fold pyridoxal phosphate-dependent enzyme [Bacteroidota bacterium]
MSSITDSNNNSASGKLAETSVRLNGIEEYYFSRKLGQIDEMNKAGKQVINLGIGSPDLPPHSDVIKTLQEEAAKPGQHGYQSYKGSPVLRNAISKWYQKWYKVELNADTEILPLMGSKEGIMHICMTYINEGDVVLIPNPGYPTYKSAAKIAGAQVQAYTLKEENNWFPDFTELEKNDLKKARLMFVNYPQMPTGQLPTEEMFKQLITFAKKHSILICHDNPYSFILNDKPMSLLSFEGAKEVVIELNSLSKSHNMAGWRIGMLLGAKERINEVLRFKSNMDSGMFLPLQLAAAKALDLDQDWIDAVNNVYKKRRKKVFELLRLLNCSFSDKQVGLFVWASIPATFKDGYELSDKVLNESNVFITPGGIFGSAGDQYIRVSLCTSEEKIGEAIERIKN